MNMQFTKVPRKYTRFVAKWCGAKKMVFLFNEPLGDSTTLYLLALSNTLKMLLYLVCQDSCTTLQLQAKRHSLESLRKLGLVERDSPRYVATALGKDLCEYFEESGEFTRKFIKEETKKLFKPEKTRLKKIEKAEEFLEMFKQGFSVSEIADLFGIPYLNVRTILCLNPEYSKIREQRKIANQKEVQKRNERKLKKLKTQKLEERREKKSGVEYDFTTSSILITFPNEDSLLNKALGSINLFEFMQHIFLYIV